MKRILHMTPPEVSNGVYRYIFHHMPFIDQNEYQFCFLTKNTEELRLSDEYKKWHFPLYRLNMAQREGRDAFIDNIRSVLSEGFDSIHLHTSVWRGFLIEEIAMEYGMQVIVHSHSSGVDFESEKERDVILKEHEYYKPLFSESYATDFCACSWKAADWIFGSQIPRDRIQILPNAVDYEKYKFDPNIRREMRYKLGISDRVVFGIVGRYSYTKNQEFLARCFNEAARENNNIYLIMIGQGENALKIRELVGKMNLRDSVLCLGWEDNINDYLQAMDVFCLPSKFEGLPISAIEAQASGLPCLVSDNVTEEVDISGLVDFLPLNEEVWKNRMVNAKRTEERPDTRQSFMESGFDVRASAERLRKLYDR